MAKPAASRPGPPPLPDNITALRGRPGHRPPRPEIKVEPIAPICPTYLSAKGKEIWKKLSTELQKNALLSKRDEYSLAACVMAVEIMLRSYADMKKGRTLQLTEEDKSHNRTRRSHAVMNFMQAQREVQRWCAEFGLSPAARVSLLGVGDAGSSAVRAAAGQDDDDPDLFI